jgi:hypothetical protein
LGELMYLGTCHEYRHESSVTCCMEATIMGNLAGSHTAGMLHFSA